MVTKISRCRLCGHDELERFVALGDQYLSGVFPKPADAQSITHGPLNLVKCSAGEMSCGLLQLEHSYDPLEMYGENYGYRSGLNSRMINHLHSKVHKTLATFRLQPGDMVIDIGSNDGTSLAAYPDDLLLVGVDPTANKFREYYPAHIRVIADFFSANLIRDEFGGRKAKLVTSHSMLYDLEDPLAFATDVRSVLASDGLWIFEQSYMPTMVANLAYDTICHEHLEYYSLRQIEWMLSRSGFRCLDVEFNDTNGGSFSVTATPVENHLPLEMPTVSQARLLEESLGVESREFHLDFSRRVAESRVELLQKVSEIRESGGKIAGIGASTKGNTLLQYCGFTASEVELIGEVNPEKFGRVTPGSGIPIVDQEDVLAGGYDGLLVLPWHFREFFLSSPLFRNQHLLFPLPRVQLVTM